VRSHTPTAALAALGLIGGYAIALATGSRPLGGLLLAACGVACLGVWVPRHGWRMAGLLAVGGLGAFALSHALGLLIGAWPAVLLTAAGTGVAYWRLSDSGRSWPLAASRTATRARTASPPPV
jgi:hypothetical protein